MFLHAVVCAFGGGPTTTLLHLNIFVAVAFTWLNVEFIKLRANEQIALHCLMIGSRLASRRAARYATVVPMSVKGNRVHPCFFQRCMSDRSVW